MKERPKEIIRRRKLRAAAVRLNKMKKRNWRKHFAEHPEQLLPGVKLKRIVPTEERELSARIIRGDPFV